MSTTTSTSQVAAPLQTRLRELHAHFHTAQSTEPQPEAGGEQQALNWSGLIEIVPNKLPIGTGGFGDVYTARWTCPPLQPGETWGGLEGSDGFPDVVIKVARLVGYGDGNMRRKRTIQFQRELAVWQQLDHPNILPLVGCIQEQDSLPAMISLFMHNGPIKQYLILNPDVPRLPMLVSMVKGLEYLHNFQPNITHGDIKADNVLVDKDGTPRLCDFGLSRMTEDRTLWATTTTSVKGTVRWMAPELFNEDVRMATMPSDIWAMGMTMLEILSGRQPFYTYANDMGVILAVTARYETPRIPEDVIVPSWLVDVWMLCWCFEPEGRPSSSELVKKMTAGISSTSADPDVNTALNYPMSSNLTPAQHSQESNPTTILPPAQSGSSVAVRMWDSLHGQEVSPFQSITDVVCCVSFSPDGSQIATGDYYAPHCVRTWTVSTGLPALALEGHKGTVEMIYWSPTEKEVILSCSGDKSVRAWNASTGETTWVHELSSWSWEFRFSPDGSCVVVIDEEVGGKVLAVSHGKSLGTFEYPDGMRLFAVAYSHGGKIIASGYKAGQVCIWDANLPRRDGPSESAQLTMLNHLVPTQFHAGDRGVYGMEFSPDDKWLATACGDDVIRLWDAESGNLIRELRGHSSVVNSVAFTADSKYLISGSWDFTFRKWDVQSGRSTLVKKCRARVFSVAVSPDGRYFLAGGG